MMLIGMSCRCVVWLLSCVVMMILKNMLKLLKVLNENSVNSDRSRLSVVELMLLNR